MSRYIIIPTILILVACNAGSAENPSNDIPVTENLAADTETTTIQEDTTAPPPDTFCYVLTEGDKNKNINAARIIMLPEGKIKGELKYLTYGQPPAVGELNGNIKDNIITADWTFIKNDTSFYRVPVAFKMTKSAIYQKPSQVNDKGEPYIPKNGEYSFEFKKVGCEYYPK